MASKKDYDKAVTKRVKGIRALDRVYGISRDAKDVRALAKHQLDTDTEKSVRGYVKGSIGDPAVRKRIKADSAKRRAKKK